MSVYQISLLGLLTWGALAFGAEYSWAYAPLLVMAIVTGVLGLRASRGVRLPSRWVLIWMLVLAAAVVVQLLPLPHAVRQAIGGANAVDFAGSYRTIMLEDLPAPIAALSIAPTRTALGLLFLVSLCILFTGVTRAISARGPREVVRGVAVLAALVAAVGILQSAIQSTALYGFWRPPKQGVPFAPFINANHFAGWMVMAMCATAGLLAADLVRAGHRTLPGWRGWRAWLLTPAASQTILVAFAMGVMALAMVVAGSRGGLVGLVVAALLLSAWVLRHQRSTPRRLVAAAGLAAIFVVAAAQGGVVRIIEDFEGSSRLWGGRRIIWQDAARIVRDYPAAGTGLNTFGIAMLRYQTGPRDEWAIEAHNDYLQLAAEGGALLGIPVLLLLATFAREVRRRFKERADDERAYAVRAGAVTGLCAIAVMEVFDFTLQMPGAAVLFVVLAAIAIHRPDYLKRGSEERRRAS